jgi:hypothetical protein
MSEIKSTGTNKIQELMMDRLEELAAVFQGMRSEMKDLKAERDNKSYIEQEAEREPYKTENDEAGIEEEVDEMEIDTDFGLTDKADHGIGSGLEPVEAERFRTWLRNTDKSVANRKAIVF